MLKQDKERIVSELAERLKNTQTLLVADYRGLTMPEIDELRTKLLESGARFTVVKNTLTRRAAEEAGTKDLLELIEGPTAIAFLDPEADPAAIAKVLNDTAKKNDVLVIRGGILEGETVSDAEIKRLASLPAMDVLRAQLAGTVFGPLTTVVGLFAAPMRDLVGILDARIDQLREQGDTSEAAEPPVRDSGPGEGETNAERSGGSPADTATAEGEPEEPAAEAEPAVEEPAAEAEAPAEEPAPEAEPAAEEPVAEAEAPAEEPAAEEPEAEVQEASTEEETSEEPQEEASNGEN
ncbi:MAG: 50S ribosomal protein L10 [Actinomycetota bacterium]|nr:50S ribosomal protein L10 [Actinomycetota bacterium]